MYRNMIKAGYKAKKADTFFHYHIHKKSLIYARNTSPHKSYYYDAGLLHTPITIFTSFAGRESIFGRYVAALRALECDTSCIHLHWYNTSSDPAFEHLLRSTIATLNFGSTQYTHAPLPKLWKHSPDSLIQQRILNTEDADYYYQLAVVRAYNYAIQTCDTEYLLTLEDDMALQPDTLKQLLQTVEWNTAAVIAPYKSGFFPRYEVWMPEINGTVRNFKQKGAGVQEVGGCGLGCTLFRTHDLRTIAPIFTGVRHTPMQWYDQLTYLRLASRGKILCNWNAEVEHMKTERHAKGLAQNFT